MRTVTATALLSILFFATGCHETGLSGSSGANQISLSTKQKNYIARGHDFDFNFINSVARNTPGDWFVSPFGMQALLGLLANGAQGETLEQILRVLDLGADDIDDMNVYFETMFCKLPKLDRKTVIDISNGAFTFGSLNPKPSFRKEVENHFNAWVENFDRSPKSIRKINNWIEKGTHGMIKDLLKHANYATLIMNVFYFNAEWKMRFKKNDTCDALFFIDSNNVITVPMMKQTGETYLYASCPDYAITKLPFGKGAFNFIIVLPDETSTLKDVASSFSRSDLYDFLTSGKQYELDLRIPKFEINTDITLNDMLIEMGLPLVFSGGDFSGFADGVTSFTTVKQDTSFRINEEGAEAAVVSSAFGLGGGVTSSAKLHANRPFMFLIQEESTNAILFAGCYTGMKQQP